MIPPRIARLNSNGSTHSSFDPGSGPNQAVNSLVVRPDGFIVAGGDFSSIDGEARSYLAVFNEDGTLAETTLDADATVEAVALQADGKTLVAGAFSILGGETHTRIARIMSDFIVETAFEPSATPSSVYALAFQEDGKVVLGGAFTSVNGETRTYLARLFNDEAIDNLNVVSVSEVFWERAGSSPELYRVDFYVKATGDPGWTLLGAGVYEPGGWRITGLTLPADGDVQARGFPHSTSSQGAVEQEAAFSITPEIQVEQPEGTILVDATSTITFPDAQTGSEQVLTFTIRNVGLDDLVLTGPSPVALTTGTSYTIVAQPSPLTLTPGSSTTFQVTFNPTTTGTKNDTLSITSDDADESPFTVALTGVATPGPGTRDNTFQPTFNGTVEMVAEDPSGQFLFGGSFTSFNSTVRNRIARALSTGGVDSTFSPSFNNSVLCAAVQEDGQILVGGAFTTKNGVTRRRLARITTTGALDSSFNPNPNGLVRSIDLDASGNILVSGEFTTIDGTACTGVAVLTPAGSISRAITGVNISAGSFPYVARFQSDGKIVVAAYTSVYRFLASGTLDFATAVSATSSALAIQSDGKILVGGSFATIGGESRTRYARLNDDGSVDTDFTCNTDSSVSGICVQADGTAVVVGNFTTFGGAATPKVARSLAAGGADTSFVTSFTAGNALASAIQEDGKPIIVGSFTVEGVAASVARLANGVATESLSVLSQTSVQWLRGGTSPEASYVTFEVSQDGGSVWTSLGSGTRVDGGWELTGTSVPTSGLLRGTARIPSDASSGLIRSTVSFSGILAPDIQVEQPTSVLVADDGTKQFAGQIVGQFVNLTFTIRNTGLATLSGISVVSSNNAEFTVQSLGATSVSAGAFTTFVVQFRPASIGAKTSTLVISSNAPGIRNPYTITLQGNGITTPVVVSNVPSAITTTTALMNGTVTARDDLANAYFQWRLNSASPWTEIASTPATTTGFTATAVQGSLTGLTAATSYQYRAAAYNSVTGAGSPVFGAIRTFSTL